MILSALDFWTPPKRPHTNRVVWLLIFKTNILYLSDVGLGLTPTHQSPFNPRTTNLVTLLSPLRIGSSSCGTRRPTTLVGKIFDTSRPRPLIVVLESIPRITSNRSSGEHPPHHMIASRNPMINFLTIGSDATCWAAQYPLTPH